MAYDKKRIQTAVSKALEESKGKRKFTQSIDLAINFTDVDFKKPENRINTDVALPHVPKELKVAIFADGQLAIDAGKIADRVISPAQITSYASDKKKQGELLQYSLLSAPKLMAVVGKQLGQLLGARGKLPKPVLPNANLAETIKRARSVVTLKTKGKYLPCLHCIVGRETMNAEEITENILTIMEAVKTKVKEPQIKSILVKTTMGKPVKITA
ncbi:MAG: 50S ribosomal protein L1 [Candidatus Micrarchaeia archaeon]